jgi:hypothetical protein
VARVEEQVLLGPGYFYVAAHTAGAAEAAPTFDENMTLTTAPGGNWEDVGYSEDGWALAGSSEFSFWTPAELVDPVATIKDAAEYHMRGVLAQFTLENLQLALSGGDITVDSAGTASTTPGLRHYEPPASAGFTYFSALFISQSYGTNFTTTEACVRMTYLPSIISVAEAEIPHTKGANPSLIGVDLQALRRGASPFRIDEQFEV